MGLRRPARVANQPDHEGERSHSTSPGRFPCLSYQTLRDPLDADGVPWRYYAPEVGQSFGGDLWNAFDGIRAVRYGSEWNTNVTWPETNVFKDITAGKLPSVSWVIPDYQNSDHPGKYIRYRTVLGGAGR